MKKNCILLLTQDLRISDNRALREAVHAGFDVIPLYIFSEEENHPWEMGSASRWWLHHSLKSLSERLQSRGSRLILRKGPVMSTLKKVIEETSSTAVFWHRRVEPCARKLEKKIEELLPALGCTGHAFFDNLLFIPGSVLNGKDEPYQVFTPFYKTCLKKEPPRAPIAAPTSLPKVSSSVKSVKLEELHLLPGKDWASEFSSLWKPGEEGALERLKKFTSHSIADYVSMRDIPSVDATSLMSPHLHFGEISPYQIWKAAEKSGRGEAYQRQIIWREFAHHMLYFFPSTDLHPLRKEYADFPWKKNSKLLSLWQRGSTGYPIVDAGMRQLWRLGFMHNRVRMIVGSFLVKDLMIPWQDGAKWFWDTLVDADLSNNSFGWQWVGGCGADAAPYFRIFNPVTQGEKFDPDGVYVRAFVPELKNLPSQWIHKPWLAPEEVLAKAGVVLGKNYPRPIVDHDRARKQALEYFHSWSKK